MAEISATIEETNALRIKLGLKPLDLKSDKNTVAQDNWKDRKEAEAKKARDDEVKQKIAKSKTKRELNKVLVGKTLGEASDDDGDAGSGLGAPVKGSAIYNWTLKSRKLEKAAAERRAKELEEMDKAFQEDYDEEQLSGLRVGHDIEDFGEGEERILTLKDSTILENEEQGDELINIQMSERERLEKNLDNKKKKNRPVYDAFDDDEFTMGKKKNLLSQYDEVLGTETSGDGFVIGSRKPSSRTPVGFNSAGGSSMAESRLSMEEKLKASAESLSYNKTQQSMDYYTKEEAEVTFKKSKKKKKSKSRSSNNNWDDDGEDNDGSAMEVEKRKEVDLSEMNFVDDEDLQQSLAASRRLATKKIIKKLTPEQIAKNLLASQPMQVEEDDNESKGMVISDVSEFVSNLSIESALAPQVPKSVTGSVAASSATPSRLTKQETAAGEDTNMDGTSEDYIKSRTRAESEEQESQQDSEMKTRAESEDEEDTSILEEPLVSRGLGSTLALLKQKGLYQEGTPEQQQRAKVQTERQRWLLEARQQEAKRDRELALNKAREKERSKDKNYSSRDREKDREYENQRREQQALDERAARMRDYKPDVKLEYIDDNGNILNAKEAFRELSHKFHGKESGKMKTEKRMKKLEDEKRLLGMSNTDTPLQMVNALQQRQKAAGAAHIVLSVGNRNAVPTTLSNFKAPAAAASVSSRHSGSESSTSGTASALGGARTSMLAFGAPAQSQPVMSVSGVHAPNREKVTFGLKRKAEPIASTQDQSEPDRKKPKDE